MVGAATNPADEGDGVDTGSVSVVSSISRKRKKDDEKLLDEARSVQEQAAESVGKVMPRTVNHIIDMMNKGENNQKIRTVNWNFTGIAAPSNTDSFSSSLHSHLLISKLVKLFQATRTSQQIARYLARYGTIQKRFSSSPAFLFIIIFLFMYFFGGSVCAFTVLFVLEKGGKARQQSVQLLTRTSRFFLSSAPQEEAWIRAREFNEAFGKRCSTADDLKGESIRNDSTHVSVRCWHKFCKHRVKFVKKKGHGHWNLVKYIEHTCNSEDDQAWLTDPKQPKTAYSAKMLAPLVTGI